MDLYGRDLICTQDWSVEGLEAVLELAAGDARNLGLEPGCVVSWHEC